MMNFDRMGKRDLRDESIRNPATDEQDTPAGFFEYTKAALNATFSENLPGAIDETREDFVAQEIQRIYDLTQDREILNDTDFALKGIHGTALVEGYQTEKMTQRIKQLQEQYPDQGFLTWDELNQQKIIPHFAKIREELSIVSANAGPFDRLMGDLIASTVELGGSELGPLAFVGPQGRVAGSVKEALSMLPGLFAKEAAVATAAEIPIQARKMYEKPKIESPYGLKDAVYNTLMAAGGAGIIRTGGSLSFDLVYLRKLAAQKRATGKPQDTAEAEVLETYADTMDQANAVRPGEPAPEAKVSQEQHVEVLERATRALDQEGRVLTQEEVNEVIPVEPSPLSTLETFNPQDILVDAKTFQFKAGGDVAGVTERLKGVQKWDPELAGMVMVWENNAGQRFIVDGHQRLALAKRAIAGGQPIDEVTLNGFLLREADGVTAGDARQRAAMKNIAEDTGTAIDIAKVLREIGGEEGLAKMPQIPLTSAKVRDARGLTNLEDESFMMVVNDLVDSRFAAVVGDLITDPAQQRAIMRGLMQNQPGNLNQARIMVGAMRDAGFEKRETMDLFGGQELTETLFKERAQVIDHMMRQVKQDKQVFSGLERNADRIVGAGNILDREANIQRFTQDERTLAALTSLANTKGPISDAINEAARRVKAGESITKASADILPAIRQQAAAEYAPRPRDGGRRPAEQEAAGVVDETAPNFGMQEVPKVLDANDKLLKPTDTIKTKAREKQRQKWVNDVLKEGTPVVGRKPVAYVMGGGGASGKGSVLEELQKMGTIPDKDVVHIDPDKIKKLIPEYNKIIETGDGRAASVVHEESSMLAKQVQAQAAERKMDIILDVTLGDAEKGAAKLKELVDSGYEVQLIGVTVDVAEAARRAVLRAQGEGRYVPMPALVKAHKGFSEGWDEYVKLSDRATLFDNNGDGPIKIAEGETGRIDILSEEEYNAFVRKAVINEKANTIAELRFPEGGRPARPGISDRPRVVQEDTRGTRQAPEVADTGRISGERLASDLPDLGDAELKNLYQDELLEARRLLDELGDVEIPGASRLDGETGDIVTEAQSLRQALDDLDVEDRMIDDMFGCIGGRNA